CQLRGVGRFLVRICGARTAAFLPGTVRGSAGGKRRAGRGGCGGRAGGRGGRSRSPRGGRASGTGAGRGHHCASAAREPARGAARVTLARGDVTAALETSPRRASLSLSIGRGGGQPMETRGLVAEYNAMAGLLTVWASSQVPHQLRQFVCELLGLEAHRVRVLAPDVGGGFGAKLIVYPEDVLIPLLALRLGRPVRWLEDRLEHMLAATQERTQAHTVEIGFDDEGRLLALRDRFTHDTGAYTPRGLVVPLLTASMLAGP